MDAFVPADGDDGAHLGVLVASRYGKISIVTPLTGAYPLVSLPSRRSCCASATRRPQRRWHRRHPGRHVLVHLVNTVAPPRRGPPSPRHRGRAQLQRGGGECHLAVLPSWHCSSGAELCVCTTSNPCPNGGPAQPPANCSTFPLALADGILRQVAVDYCKGAAWCPRMVVVPGGTFVMGSPPTRSGPLRRPASQRRVTIQSVCSGKVSGDAHAVGNKSPRPQPDRPASGQPMCLCAETQCVLYFLYSPYSNHHPVARITCYLSPRIHALGRATKRATHIGCLPSGNVTMRLAPELPRPSHGQRSQSRASQLR